MPEPRTPPRRAPDRDAKIAPTAHYTAYVWRRLGLPWSELFATTKGAALFWAFRLSGEWIATTTPGVPSMEQYLAQRHLAIEHALEGLAPDLVIEIGAGLSRRGITWALDRGVRYVEVDLPHMTAEKRAAVERSLPEDLRARLGATLDLVSRDVLDDDFGAWLRARVAGAARPVVIAEGLLGYFPRDERLRLARAIRHALAPARGAFLCDLRAREGGPSIAIGARVLRAGITLVTRGRGAREDFAGLDDVRRFFADAGFLRADPIDLRDVPRAPRVPSPARVWHARAH